MYHSTHEPISGSTNGSTNGPARDILVVADDWALRELLHMLLEDLGYDVRETTDEISTLEVVEEAAEPLIVVLDLSLADLRALDVLRAVGHDPELCFRHAYLLLLSPQDVLPCDIWPLTEALAMPVLRKPLDLDRLFETVAALAGRLQGVQVDADLLGL
ncbi:MAG TPA: response regulator [Ktedonobacterales bacterium]